MKKLSLVVVVLLLVSWVTYGQSCENVNDDRVIKGKDMDANSPGGKITLADGAYGYGGWIYIKPGDGSAGDGHVIMELASSSRVGIGVPNPANKLDVNGTVQMTGFKLTTGATNGYVLTSNSSGIGTWQLQWLKNGNDIYYNTGNVGIGTSPSEKLHVNGTVRMNGFKLTTGAASGYVLTSDGSGLGTWQSVPLQWSEVGNDIYYSSGNVGIGTSPSEKLHVNGTVRMSGFKLTTGAASGYVLTSDGSGLGTWQSVPLQWSVSGSDIYYNTGNVCIGTATPESELTVDGTITTKEMKVKLTGWPDFVFADNYKLMPLNKLENHIKKEKSLPGIPKNKEIVEEGVYVGEMQAKLLEKVEELTLYVIELNKEVKDLRKENEELKQKISALGK